MVQYHLYSKSKACTLSITLLCLFSKNNNFGSMSCSYQTSVLGMVLHVLHFLQQVVHQIIYSLTRLIRVAYKLDSFRQRRASCCCQLIIEKKINNKYEFKTSTQTVILVQLILIVVDDLPLLRVVV